MAGGDTGTERKLPASPSMLLAWNGLFLRQQDCFSEGRGTWVFVQGELVLSSKASTAEGVVPPGNVISSEDLVHRCF